MTAFYNKVFVVSDKEKKVKLNFFKKVLARWLKVGDYDDLTFLP